MSCNDRAGNRFKDLFKLKTLCHFFLSCGNYFLICMAVCDKTASRLIFGIFCSKIIHILFYTTHHTATILFPGDKLSVVHLNQRMNLQNISSIKCKARTTPTFIEIIQSVRDKGSIDGRAERIDRFDDLFRRFAFPP